MWAAYIALVNQQLASEGKGTIGFINPTIYAQNITSEYATDFHDISSGKSGSYSAVKRVAPVRRQLGFRTIFNLAGPLTNPAGARHQLLGVFAPELTDRLAGVLGALAP